MNLKNKNDIILVVIVGLIILVTIVLVISLISIWSSKGKNNQITSYTYTGYEDKMINLYQNQVRTYLNESYNHLLIEKLDSDFLEKNQLSKENEDEIKQFFDENALLANAQATIIDYTLSINEKTGIFVIRFSYYNKYGEKKYVNLIEKEPYVYTLSFEIEAKSEEKKGELIGEAIENKEEINTNVSTSAREKIKGEYKGIQFEITLEEATQRSLKYNAKIVNQGNDTVQFDFNNVASTELRFTDGSKIKLASVVARASSFYALPTNSTYNQEFFFNVPLNKQGKIKSMVLYRVLIGDKTETIEIKF